MDKNGVPTSYYYYSSSTCKVEACKCHCNNSPTSDRPYPFFENAWIDDVSMSFGMGASSANSSLAALLHLPLYWRAADTLMALYEPLLLSP